MWGGKRAGAGRQKGKERDWNKYRVENKRKKLAEASKSSMDIKNFFSKKSSSISESEPANTTSKANKKEEVVEGEPLKVDEATDAESEVYKVEERVDCRDEDTGAWFEDEKERITLNDRVSGCDGLAYHAKYEGYEDSLEMEVEPVNGRDSAGNTKQGVALPAGWEEIQDADGKTYYVDQIPGLHSCNTLDLVLQS